MSRLLFLYLNDYNYIKFSTHMSSILIFPHSFIIPLSSDVWNINDSLIIPMIVDNKYSYAFLNSIPFYLDWAEPFDFVVDLMRYLVIRMLNFWALHTSNNL